MAWVRRDTRRIPGFQGMNLPRPDSLIRSGSPPVGKLPDRSLPDRDQTASADSWLKGNP